MCSPATTTLPPNYNNHWETVVPLIVINCYGTGWMGVWPGKQPDRRIARVGGRPETSPVVGSECSCCLHFAIHETFVRNALHLLCLLINYVQLRTISLVYGTRIVLWISSSYTQCVAVPSAAIMYAWYSRECESPSARISNA